jgi:hypothetical protein
MMVIVKRVDAANETHHRSVEEGQDRHGLIVDESGVGRLIGLLPSGDGLARQSGEVFVRPLQDVGFVETEPDDPSLPVAVNAMPGIWSSRQRRRPPMHILNPYISDAGGEAPC